MAARDVLKNINLFFNGVGFAGNVEDYTPPEHVLKVEEFQAGGMYSPIELTMGMEKMETSGSIVAYDQGVLTSFTPVEGQNVQWTVRGHLESFDGTTSAVQHAMRGKLKKISRGTWEAGKKPSLKFDMAVSYFKETRDGTTILEIDVENMIFNVNGVDMLAAMKSNLGM